MAEPTSNQPVSGDPAEEKEPPSGETAETVEPAEGADESEPPLVDAAEVFRERAEQLAAERDEMNDRMLRALAEAENTRRRAARDREEAEKYGSVRLARDLLAVYDNLDRALNAADDTVRANAPDFIAGVELTKRELLNAFAKHRIEPVAPEVGDKFDPNLHQAMFEAEVPGAEPGSIVQVMTQGFTIADRLLRAAMVGVAKSGAPDAPKESSEPASPEDAEETASAPGTQETPDTPPETPPQS